MKTKCEFTIDPSTSNCIVPSNQQCTSTIISFARMRFDGDSFLVVGLCINVQCVQPVCCLFHGKTVTITLCVGAELYNGRVLSSVWLHHSCTMHLREGPSSASFVQSDRSLFLVDIDEPNSVDEGRVQQGVCLEC